MDAWPAGTDASPAGASASPAGTAAAPADTDAWPAGADGLPGWTGPSHADAREFLGLAARLGVTIPAVPTSDGIRFVDLEQAALGNNYAELAYLRIGFPTCWWAKSVPEPERGQAEAAYHATWRSLTGTGSPRWPRISQS
jgi:hypothetical protein